MVEDLVLLGAGPAAVLVKRASDAVGGLFRSRQIIRIAEAEADAKLIHARTDVEIENLRERARSRARTEEMIHQNNMELILAKSIDHLGEDASPEKMEQDWIINFFEKGRLISDEGMQELWARILAGEANRPGSFSRRTVNIMNDIDEKCAELFVNACGYVWQVGSQMIPIFHSDEINRNHIYDTRDIIFLDLQHLEDVGLLRHQGLGIQFTNDSSSPVVAIYFGKIVEINLQENQSMHISNTIFTVAGRELYSLVRSSVQPVEGFFEFVYDKWANESWVPPRTIQPDTPETTD